MFEDIIRAAVLLASFTASIAFAVAALAELLRDADSFERRVARRLRLSRFAWARAPRLTPGSDRPDFDFAVRVPGGVVFLTLCRNLVGDIRVDSKACELHVEPPDSHPYATGNPGLEARRAAIALSNRRRWRCTIDGAAVLPGRATITGDDRHEAGLINGIPDLGRYLAGAGEGGHEDAVDAAWRDIKSASGRPYRPGVPFGHRLQGVAINTAGAAACFFLAIAVWQMHAY